MRPMLVPIVAVVSCTAAVAWAGPVERAGELVGRLGSADYRERESAFRELDNLGEAALRTLKSARASFDTETAKRAAELIERIQRRASAARILAPKTVDINLDDVPIPEAVRELATKTGLPLELIGDRGILAGRKITYRSGPVTAWEALAGFTRAASLTEWDGLSAVSGIPVAVPQATVDAAQQLMLPQGRVIVRSSSTTRNAVSPYASKIVLYDGTPPAEVALCGGAARLRALSPGLTLPNVSAGADEFLLPLQVSLESRLAWAHGGRPTVRIAQATDESGQRLTANILNTATPAVKVDDLVVFGAMEMPMGRPGPTHRSQYVSLRFRRGEKPTRVLRDVTGTLTLPLRMAGEVVAIDNPLAAPGKSARAANGSMTIHSASRTNSGDVKFDVSIELPPGIESAWPIAGNMQMRFQNGAMVQQLNGAAALSGGPTDYMGLSLSDASGHRFRAAHVSQQQVSYTADGIRVRLGLTYRSGKGTSAPSRLTYSAMYPTTVELPFAFSELPMP